MNQIYFFKCQKADEKKGKEEEQTLEELNSAHHRSQAKCQLVNQLHICNRMGPRAVKD